jgi:hypothetical protein
MAPIDAPSGAIAQPVLSGRHEIAALWLPHEWYDEASRRSLVLQAWSPGCTLLRFADGDLLRLPAPVDCISDGLPGWPLRRVGGRLCSADVDPRQLDGQGHADVLLAMGAAWRVLSLADAAAVDPSSWLDVSIGFIDTADCRLPPPERVVVAPPARALREVLGPNVPATPSDETVSLLKALAQRQQRESAGAGQRAAPTHAGFSSSRGGAAKVAAAVATLVIVAFAISRLGDAPESGSGEGSGLPPGLVMAFGYLVFFLLRGRGSAGVQGAAGGSNKAGARPGRVRGDALARARSALRQLPARASRRVMPRRWRNWAARLAMTTGIADLLGAQHAAYLRRMMRMFDEGKLDEALRHAIPLGGDQASLGQSFGLLKARDQLSLQRQQRATTAIGLGDDIETHLRKLYRHSFEQLDRQGRIDEAVFILAELLRARQEALDYLEKHGRFEQAAELALGWDMPAAQIVRLHALSGNWRLAVLVARRDNAFEAAVTLLERRWPEAATQLRKEWALSLVSRGQWLAAVHVAWRIESERAQASQWLEVAEGGGGTMAARALALRAQCLPDTLATHDDFIAALGEDPQLVAERTALARELLALPAPTSPAARRLAALVAGAAIADLAQVGPPASLEQSQAKLLVGVAGDAALSADLPASGWPGRTRSKLVDLPGTVGWFAPEAGTHDIVDAVVLPDGEFLVALGEAGAVRIDARGQWRARFPVPAHQLVIADDGRSALALARRERTWRVSRLDLVRGRAEDLGMHEFDAFARSFDGVGWSVAIGRRVQVLDTTRGLGEALWQVADLPGAVVALDVHGDTELWLLATSEGHEQWMYKLPGRRLAWREALPPPGLETSARFIDIGLGAVEFTPPAPYDDDGTARVRLLHDAGRRFKDVPWHGKEAVVAIANGWLAQREPLADDATEQAIALVGLGTGRVHGRWFWPRGARLRARVQGGTWVLFDDQGRVSAVSVDTAEPVSVSVR